MQHRKMCQPAEWPGSHLAGPQRPAKIPVCKLALDSMGAPTGPAGGVPPPLCSSKRNQQAKDIQPGKLYRRKRSKSTQKLYSAQQNRQQPKPDRGPSTPPGSVLCSLRLNCCRSGPIRPTGGTHERQNAQKASIKHRSQYPPATHIEALCPLDPRSERRPSPGTLESRQRNGCNGKIYQGQPGG